MKLKLGIFAYDITLYKSYVFFLCLTGFVAMPSKSFHRLIMGKVETVVLLGMIELYFLQKCFWNGSPHFIRFLSELLNLIGCWGNIYGLFFNKSASRKP